MFFSVNLNNFNDDLIQSDPIDIVNCPSGWIYIEGKYEIYLSTVFSIHLKGSSSSSSQSVIIIVIIKSRESTNINVVKSRVAENTNETETNEKSTINKYSNDGLSRLYSI